MTDYDQPSLVVFAGPNGSGKSTITSLVSFAGVYVNADDIQRVNQCDPLAAAQMAEAMRNNLLSSRADFTFETVLSTERNLNLLKKAKDTGYFVRVYYVLTRNANINVARVAQRVANGGHDVPEDKIRSRYERCIKLIPEVMAVADIFNVYDNTKTFRRIFSKKRDVYRVFPNELWSFDDIVSLTQVPSQKICSVIASE